MLYLSFNFWFSSCNILQSFCMLQMSKFPSFTRLNSMLLFLCTPFLYSFIYPSVFRFLPYFGYSEYGCKEHGHGMEIIIRHITSFHLFCVIFLPFILRQLHLVLLTCSNQFIALSIWHKDLLWSTSPPMLVLPFWQ